MRFSEAGPGLTSVINMNRAAKQLVVVLLVLVVLALLTRVVSERQALYQLAAVIVIGLALLTGLKLVLDGLHGVVGWVIACAVVPCYLVLLGILGPSEPEKFIDIAYVFGTLYGAIAGGAGVVIGLIVRRRRNQSGTTGRR